MSNGFVLNAMKKSITIDQVAQQAGIGLGTASRALSGRGSVSPETRERVLRIAAQIGYEANPHAQRLANGRVENTVAIFAGIDLGIATLRLWQIQGCLNEKDYITDVHLLPSYVADQEQRQIKILRDLRRMNPAAIVSQTMGLDEGARRELRQYQESGGIVFTFDEPVDLSCDQVIVDQEDSTYQGTKHLLDMGHRAISYLRHTTQNTLDDLRLRGVKRALREKGLALHNEKFFYDELNESEGPEMAQMYLAIGQKPTAVISNDASASVFMHALIRRGVRVPEELSIVGYDNTPPAQTAIVPITSVAYPLEQVGHHIAEMVQSRLDGTYTGAPRHITLRGTLLQRESVAPPLA
ncbi:MAG TPA: LacI family DNA-binding transcriptional regulator [Abditibacteriaceae bacterium]|jgi:LacI family transcriptional regulator